MIVEYCVMSWKITDTLQSIEGSAKTSASGSSLPLTTEASRSCVLELPSKNAGDTSPAHRPNSYQAYRIAWVLKSSKLPGNNTESGTRGRNLQYTAGAAECFIYFSKCRRAVWIHRPASGPKGPLCYVSNKYSSVFCIVNNPLA